MLKYLKSIIHLGKTFYGGTFDISSTQSKILGGDTSLPGFTLMVSLFKSNDDISTET